MQKRGKGKDQIFNGKTKEKGEEEDEEEDKQEEKKGFEEGFLGKKREKKTLNLQENVFLLPSKKNKEKPNNQKPKPNKKPKKKV